MATSSKYPKVSESLKAVLALLNETNDLEHSDISRYSMHLVLADAQLMLLDTAIRTDALAKHKDVLSELHGRNWANDVKRSIAFMFKKYGLPKEQVPAVIKLKLNEFMRHAIIIDNFITEQLARVLPK